jgi:hypothetical protein
VATTLLNLRLKLNGELGVVTDAETTPWPKATRDNAICDGYAALWRNGVWKALKQDYPTVEGQVVYPITAELVYPFSKARRLNRLELLDSSSNVVSRPTGFIEPDGSGSTQLVLTAGCAEGYTLRVYGWTAYISVFPLDATPDDLDAEYNRIPLLKAKAICYRQQLAMFARYGERQAVPPEMNMTIDQILGVVAAAEREFADECRALASLRPRVGQTRHL